MRPYLLLIFSCLQQYVVAQGFEETFRFEDPENSADIRHTRDEILKHSASTQKSWEGEYRGNYGDDSFDSIFVSVKDGFAMLEHGNTGIHAGNCGVIEVKNSEISVFLRYKERHHSIRFSKQLLIVPWGDAYFLVP